MMLKDYLRIQGKTMDDLREDLRPGVEGSLKRSLVLGEIVEQEELEISDEELGIQIAESSEQYGERAEEVRAALNAPDAQRDIRNRMLANKAVQQLVAIAKGEVSEAAAAEQEPAEAEASQEPEEQEETET
jgi:FKBP-type peptidyl-prolyl cis-trans isomerase (trigger factor)